MLPRCYHRVVAADDEETTEEAAEPMSKRAEEALARARKAVADQTPKKSQGSRALPLIPVTNRIVMMALLMPRATEPDAVPVPTVDPRALHATMQHDDELAAKAKGARLPTDVLAVGTGV